MRQSLCQVLALFLLSGFCFVASPAQAGGWFDEYSSTVTNDPSHFETQKRNNFSLGGASYRVKTDSQPLVSLTTPKIKSGCGGIDGFWGGLSYLDPEYMVQAFQNIMSAAPAFAFRIGLKVLCEQCDNVMTSLEGLANKLNQMAMDECGMTRGLTNAAGNFLTSSMGEKASQGTASQNGFFGNLIDTASQGANEASNFLDTIYETEFCGYTDPGTSSLIGKCKRYANMDGPDSFWTKIGRMEGAKANHDGDTTSPFVGCEDGNCEFVDLLAGVFGDIYFGKISKRGGSEDNLNMADIKYIAPLDKENTGPESLMEKLIKIPSAGSTEVVTELPGMHFTGGDDSSSAYSQSNIEIDAIEFGERAHNEINKIWEAITSGDMDKIDSDTVDFINEQVQPIWTYINTFSYKYTSGGSIKSEATLLAKVAAVSHAFYFLNNVGNIAQNYGLQHTNELSSSAKYAPINLEKWKEAQRSLLQRIRSHKASLYEAYKTRMSDMRESLSESLKMQTLEAQLKTNLRDGFSTRPFMYRKQ